jgi:hypothetical protein
MFRQPLGAANTCQLGKPGLASQALAQLQRSLKRPFQRCHVKGLQVTQVQATRQQNASLTVLLGSPPPCPTARASAVKRLYPR